MKTILLTCVMAFVIICLSVAYKSQQQSNVQRSFKTAQSQSNSSGYILDATEGDAIGNNLIKVDPARGSMRLGMATQSFRAGRGIALHKHESEDEILFILKGTGWGVVGKQQKEL